MSKNKKVKFVCLYHRADTDDVSVEDILQKAFGGKKTSSTLICGACNNKLGSTIDKVLADSLEWITTMINPVGRRRSPATLKNVADQNGKKWHILPGGKPSVPYRSLAPNSWEGDVSQFEIIKNNVEAKAKAMGIDDPVIDVKHEHTKAGAIQFELKIDNQIAFRSACKSALEALALIGFDEVDRRSDLLLNARNFVMNGDDYTHVGWLEKSLLDNAFDSLEHRILLVQSDDLSVYWEFILYGGIVAVSGRFLPINKRIENWMYQVCPKTGVVFDGTVQIPNVPSDFKNWSPITTQALQNRLAVLLQKVNLDLVTNTIVDECMDEVDQMGVVDQNEYIQKTAVMVVERTINAVAELTGKDPKEVVTFLYKQIARNGQNR